MPDENAKRLWPALPQAWRRSAIVLGVIFATEYSLMIALPWLLPQKTPRILEAAVDSVLLTMIVIPVLWWTIVYPLQQAARQRDQFLRNADECQRSTINNGFIQAIQVGYGWIPDRWRISQSLP